jgi:two-component system, OmpR family, KDP operon response regulator KdpE
MKQPLDRPPDLLILDLSRCALDSDEVISRLRAWPATPVIVLPGRSGIDSDAVSSAIARGATPGRGSAHVPRFRIGDVVVDLAARRVTRQSGTIDTVGTVGTVGQAAGIRLTPTEWRLLEALLRSPGRLLPREQLLAEVWGPGYDRATGNLRLFMTQLRRKLEPDPARPRWLITEPGVGYRFQPSPQPASRPPCRALRALGACPVRRPRAAGLGAPAGRVRHERLSHDR